MGSGKTFRHEKQTPSSCVIVSVLVLIALCLIGAWVWHSPSKFRSAEESDGVAVDLDEMLESKASGDHGRDTFEDSVGDLTLENEEKADETPKEQLDMKESSEQKDEDTTRHEILERKSEKPEPERRESEERKTDVLESELNLSEGDATSELEKDSEAEESGVHLTTETEETSDTWDTQISDSKEEKEKVELEQVSEDEKGIEASKDMKNYSKKRKEKKASQEGSGIEMKHEIEWTLCDFEGASDYIPCLDNMKAIKALYSTKHYEHRERHCPDLAPTCLVPFPDGYRIPIRWPQSRNEVWYANVPHPGLVSYKKDQNWVKKKNDKLVFPGGGTQFKHGALHYIDYVEQSFPKIAWGRRTRVILDVGCGVASFGGYIFDRDVLTMSFAPKDEHEAQVQLALERGIPAISSVMGTQRLVFPSNVFDAVHCARCRVPWHIEGGKLLLELNRVLRPGGYFVWSATPVYWAGEEDVQIWKEMAALTSAMCWKLVAKFVDSSTGIGAAIFQKPTTNHCYENRKKDFPPMCDEDDKPDAAWYVPMTACIHRIPDDEGARVSYWPQEWPLRLTEAPKWLNSQIGEYGKTAAEDFLMDTQNWLRTVQKSYLRGLGIEWKNVRNVMDMRAVYGGFAAALSSQSVWVMNVVPSDAAYTLPIIFDRGMFGIYHDWCESFSSYPRTYDLLHADHLFNRIKKRCDVKVVVAEMDRLLRPEGWAIVRDTSDSNLMSELQALFESLHWAVRMSFSKGREGLLAAQKTRWRPDATF